MTQEFFEIPATGITGQKFDNLNFEAGDFATLVVNVASNCDLTEQNYDELVQLQQEYGDDGFTVLAFPSDDFDQEPYTNEEIFSKMQAKHGVNFPMFEKTHVNGADEHALYRNMKEQGNLDAVEWNFQKFLIDSEGKVIKVFPPDVNPLAIKPDIE